MDAKPQASTLRLVTYTDTEGGVRFIGLANLDKIAAHKIEGQLVDLQEAERIRDYDIRVVSILDAEKLAKIIAKIPAE